MENASPQTQGVKKCRAPEFGAACDLTLRPSNKSGFCTAHFHYSLRKKNSHAHPNGLDEASARLVKNLDQMHKNLGRTQEEEEGQHPPTPSPILTRRGPDGVECSIMVPIDEKSLDRLWMAMSFEEKAHALFPHTQPAEGKPHGL